MFINQRIKFERILCPIGQTPDSGEGLSYALALAKSYRAKLLVMHCVTAPAASPADRHNAEASLQNLVAKHLYLPSDPFDMDVVVVEGDPQIAITREAAERQIDLIVMRSRRRPYAAALLGSTAETLCRTAPCPVLISHPREQEWAGMPINEAALRRVLVAHDFSDDSELALSYGLSLAQEYQAELHLLHVLPLRPRSEAPEIARLPLSAETAFDETVNRLRRAVPDETYRWCKVRHIVREGHPYREVLDYAQEQSIDLICMGASGTGFGMHALFGSNADRVLRQASCPTLIARPLKPMVALSAAQT